jgi:asparagine synthase (glutamine-hydrolysing)
MVNINIEADSFWERHYIGTIVIYIKGYIYSHTIKSICNYVRDLREEDVESFINSLDGHFAIVVQKEEFVFMAVDKIRSTALFFTIKNNSYYIDSNPVNIVEKFDFKKNIRDDSVLEFSMSGYVIGNKTVYKDLHCLKAGELVVFSNDSLRYFQYYKYFGDIEYKDYGDYIEDLSKVTLNIFKKMLGQIGDRQIVIPLSAGNDSRLVASALKHLGAINVKCYSYGSIGGFEGKIAQVVSKKLGYDWIFIPLTYRTEKKYYALQDYKKYLRFSETYCSAPYTQSLSAIKYLKDMGLVDEDAVFINGNSGDFISGAHISSLKNSLSDYSNKEQRKDNILNILIEKHFSLWGYLKSEKNVEKIKILLWNEIVLTCGELKDKSTDHLFYEYSEFIDRQSKYVISGQKTYEFYGYDWRLPLWDDEYLFFWQKVPAELKEHQKLYTDMLKKKNFGNVWGDDILVNKKNITPKWIIPLRFISKIFFSLFGNYGKTMWKQFERVVFNYWMINTHTLKAFSYLRILADFNKKPRGIYPCWFSHEYVSKLKNRNF